MNKFNIDTQNAPKRIWQNIVVSIRQLLTIPAAPMVLVGIIVMIQAGAIFAGSVLIGIGLLIFLQAFWMSLFSFYDAEEEDAGKVGQITSLGMKGIIFRTMEGELRPLRVSDEKWHFSVADPKIMKKLNKLHEEGVDVKLKFKRHVHIPSKTGKTNVLVYSAEAIGGENEK